MGSDISGENEILYFFHPVPETALHQRRAARGRALLEPLNRRIVDQRRDAHLHAWRRWEELLDYSSYDDTLDRIKQLESRVLELERAKDATIAKSPKVVAET